MSTKRLVMESTAAILTLTEYLRLELGKNGRNINAIAWRAYALAVESYSTVNRKILSIFDWFNSETSNATKYSNRYHIKQFIRKWADAAELVGSFKGDNFIVGRKPDPVPDPTESAEVDPKPVEDLNHTESAKVEQKVEEPIQTESAKIEPETEERTDFQKYVDRDLSNDPVLIDKEWDKVKEYLASKGKDWKKFVEVCDKNLKIKDTLDKMARKYVGDKSCSSDLVQHYTTKDYLDLRPGKKIYDLDEEMRDYAKQIKKACSSDEEDERCFNNVKARSFCLIYLKKYWKWLLDLDGDI